MDRPFSSFSRLIEQERQRCAPFRRALPQPDQAAFDSLCVCITRHIQADVYLSRPRTVEAIILAVPLDHEMRIRILIQELERDVPSTE
jgi:hypothetical protein